VPRTRWIVIGFLLAAGICGGVLNARGPFAAHPSLAYPQFLEDFEAGRVEQIVEWRDQLEVTEGSQLLLVDVPPEADLAADLGRARAAGGVGISWATIPDAWLGLRTPWVPFLILLAGVLLWGGALVRSRRAMPSPQAPAAS
jgi:hypothetical protein